MASETKPFPMQTQGTPSECDSENGKQVNKNTSTAERYTTQDESRNSDGDEKAQEVPVLNPTLQVEQQPQYFEKYDWQSTEQIEEESLCPYPYYAGEPFENRTRRVLWKETRRAKQRKVLYGDPDSGPAEQYAPLWRNDISSKTTYDKAAKTLGYGYGTEVVSEHVRGGSGSQSVRRGEAKKRTKAFGTNAHNVNIDIKWGAGGITTSSNLPKISRGTDPKPAVTHPWGSLGELSREVQATVGPSSREEKPYESPSENDGRSKIASLIPPPEGWVTHFQKKKMSQEKEEEEEPRAEQQRKDVEGQDEESEEDIWSQSGKSEGSRKKVTIVV